MSDQVNTSFANIVKAEDIFLSHNAKNLPTILAGMVPFLSGESNEHAITNNRSE